MNRIDTLTSREFADGEEFLNEIAGAANIEADGIDHDGVELSMNGSDDEAFPEAEDNTEHTEQSEPGEVESSDEEEGDSTSNRVVQRHSHVWSKVVKVNHDRNNNTNNQTDKYSKFAHL